jgi:2',3'-cyclic-nucleotide 2'-phosphodiesterase (5'-nucleotidase family)
MGEEDGSRMGPHRNVTRWVFAFTVVLAALAAPAWLLAAESAPPAAPADAAEVTILHVNDSHGQLEPYTVLGKSFGGYARLATLVGDIRAGDKSDRLFLVDAGDILSRGDDLTRKTLGSANITLMNHLKFDLWTPGNGDYYDGLPNLQARIRQASFPTLAANVRIKASGEPLAQTSVIEKAGPVRVAFFGLCLVKADDAYAAPLLIADPLATAAALVPKLREQADVVVAVSHLGYFADLALAKDVPGIDLVVGAHTHVELATGLRINGPAGGQTLVVQTGEMLANLGEARLKLRKAEGRWRVTESTERLIPIDDKIKMDPTVTAMIARMAKAAASLPMPPDPYTRPSPAKVKPVPAGAP